MTEKFGASVKKKHFLFLRTFYTNVFPLFQKNENSESGVYSMSIGETWIAIITQVVY